MPNPVEHFAVFRFSTPLEATTMGSRLMAFLTSGPVGGAFLLDTPRRAVIKLGTPAFREPVLYLSEGAVAAARQAGLPLPPASAMVSAADTAGANLLVGDAIDYLPPAQS
jgi:hypothetical protein